MTGAMQLDQPVGASDLMRAQSRLEHLVGKLEPTGKYATVIVRDVGRPEVHLAFEHQGDARSFAAVVNAEAIVGYSGWATQQAFLLNDVTVAVPMTKQPPPRDKLKHEIFVLEGIIKANASVLTSKTMSTDDRQALKRQIAIRTAHWKLLQQRLDRLSN